jgi:hypothetical protein
VSEDRLDHRVAARVPRHHGEHRQHMDRRRPATATRARGPTRRLSAWIHTRRASRTWPRSSGRGGSSRLVARFALTRRPNTEPRRCLSAGRTTGVPV